MKTAGVVYRTGDLTAVIVLYGRPRSTVRGRDLHVPVRRTVLPLHAQATWYSRKCCNYPTFFKKESSDLPDL
eukprot:SAG22_NODE_1668_length_3850_cov_3.516662_1_plen_71_part_10